MRTGSQLTGIQMLQQGIDRGASPPRKNQNLTPMPGERNSACEAAPAVKIMTSPAGENNTAGHSPATRQGRTDSILAVNADFLIPWPTAHGRLPLGPSGGRRHRRLPGKADDKRGPL